MALAINRLASTRDDKERSVRVGFRFPASVTVIAVMVLSGAPAVLVTNATVGRKPVSITDVARDRLMLEPSGRTAGAAVEPLALDVGDVNADGVPDLIAAYGEGGAGFVEIRFGEASAVYPYWQTARHARVSSAPFGPVAQIAELPLRPEVVDARDVTGDGRTDIVAREHDREFVAVLVADVDFSKLEFRPANMLPESLDRAGGEPGFVEVEESDVVARMTARLNEDALGDEVLLRRGALAPEIELSRTASVFHVNTSVERGPGSLRQAMLDANVSPGPDRIEIAIASGPQTIRLASPLPEVTESVVIDATTQPGYAGTPLIELLGMNEEPSFGMTLGSGTSVVRGFAFNKAGLYGAALEIPSDGNIVEANFFALNLDGTTAYPNVGGDVRISGDGNIFGGTASEARNVHYGLHGAVSVENGNGNRVCGNAFGVNPEETEGLSLYTGGVSFYGACTGNIVGGSEAGAGNLIAGAVDLSRTMQGSSNQVLGNTFLGYSNETGYGAVAEVVLSYTQGNPGDERDVDDGPNGLQNAPLLTSATIAAAGVRVAGLLSSTPHTTFRIEVFAGRPPGALQDLSAFRRYVGFVDVTTDASGIAGIDGTLPVDGVAKGWLVTASATGPEGTSELSNCAVVGKRTMTIASLEFDAAKPLLRVKLTPKKVPANAILFVNGTRMYAAKVRRQSGTITLNDSGGTIPLREGVNSVLVASGGVRTQAVGLVWNPE